ncbi:MAG TPA: RsiV family protein [Vicinamibacteria bacterium]|nr:RsiV family protein [Vicinamibacteria bacterium]
MYNRFLPWLIILVACEEPPAPPPPEPKTLVFDMKTVEDTLAGCTAGAPDCAYVRFDHATLVETPPELFDGAEAIVDAIEQFLSRPLREGQEGGPPQRLAERFLREYRARDDPSEAPWFLERKVFVIHNTHQAVTLSFSERSCLGQPLRESFRYANFDPHTGERLTLTKVLVEGKLEELRLVAEDRFREVRGLDANTDLEEAGFRFEEKRFTLTENFAVEANGLSFYYNPGEVAPYSLGPTEIRLSYDELNGLLSLRLGAD